jgi:hypothetical protein
VLIDEVTSNGLGQLDSFTYTVPATATVGIHHIAAQTGTTIWATTTFTVTE